MNYELDAIIHKKRDWIRKRGSLPQVRWSLLNTTITEQLRINGRTDPGKIILSKHRMIPIKRRPSFYSWLFNYDKQIKFSSLTISPYTLQKILYVQSCFYTVTQPLIPMRFRISRGFYVSSSSNCDCYLLKAREPFLFSVWKRLWSDSVKIRIYHRKRRPGRHSIFSSRHWLEVKTGSLFPHLQKSNLGIKTNNQLYQLTILNRENN